MRAAFISDIHGNAIALEAVLNDIEKQAIEKVYVLGDLCYRGPDPKRSLELVQSLQTDVIKGNADEWVVRGVQTGEVPDQALDLMQKEQAWTVSQLSEADIHYLASLPEELHIPAGDKKIHAFHATPSSLFDVVLPSAGDEELQGKLMNDSADVFIYGHIHKPFVRVVNGQIVMNIGSVGLPFDGLQMASYGIVDWSADHFSVSVRRVAVDADEVARRYEEVNYPNLKMIDIIRQASL